MIRGNGKVTLGLILIGKMFEGGCIASEPSSSLMISSHSVNLVPYTAEYSKGVVGTERYILEIPKGSLSPKKIVNALETVIMYPDTFKKVIKETLNISEKCSGKNDNLNVRYEQFKSFSQSVSHACNLVENLIEGKTLQDINLGDSTEKEVACSLLRQLIIEAPDKTEYFRDIINKMTLNDVKTKNLLSLSLLKLGACSPVLACEYKRYFTWEALRCYVVVLNILSSEENLLARPLKTFSMDKVVSHLNCTLEYGDNGSDSELTKEFEMLSDKFCQEKEDSYGI